MSVGAKSVIAAAAAAALLTGSCTSSVDRAGGAKSGHPLVLHVLNVRSSAEVQPFVDKVTEMSSGTVRIDTVNEWKKLSTTSEIDAIHEVQAGRFDLAIVPARAWRSVGVTSFDALIAPLQIESMALQQKVLASHLTTEMLAGLAPLGLRGIGILPGPMRKPAGITRPLLAPSDYRGARIGLNRSAVADHALRALGATPVPTALDGADITSFDGIEAQASAVAGNLYDGVVHSITDNVHLWPRPLVVFGMTSTLGRLTTRQLGWLSSAVHDSIEATAAVQMSEDTELTSAMCRRGKADLIAATPAQLQQLRAAFGPVYTWLRTNPQTSRFMDRIAALRSEVTAYPQEALTCAKQPRATAAATPAPAPPPTATDHVRSKPTPFDGTYRLVTTHRDGLTTDPNVVPANWGSYVFVFDRGRFAFTQTNAFACTWGYGTYTVTGDQVAWTFLDGGGMTPDGATNEPGEHFVYGWSRYRDLVRLTTVPGAVSPAPLILHAWRLVNRTPSASYLNAQCPPPPTALTR